MKETDILYIRKIPERKFGRQDREKVLGEENKIL